MDAAPPTGTVTVVLGDVAGSTWLWQEHPDAMTHASKRVTEIVGALATTHHGHLPREQGEGDNVVAAFGVASDGAAFALAVDEALAAEPWPGGITIGMRIGIHTGDVMWDEAIGYLGPTFNRCARIRDLGHARMILLSQAYRDIVAEALPPGATIEDLGSHQLRDLSRSEHVYLLRQPGERQDFPPLKSVTSLPNNLPVPLTSLVGRDEDIPTIGGLLADHRLVTLTGAGGSGKTRLAQHVASDVLHFAPDGAWWVDLTPLVEDERVPAAIGEAVGTDDVVTNEYGAQMLAAAIGERGMLLVVDNCEHVIDAVADTLEVVLSRCPGVRVLATSREALDIPGEYSVRVRPLPQSDVPDPSLEDLRQDPATRLFLERATTLVPESLDARGRQAVAAICRRLDGVPLAIELAAARTRMLSVLDIEAGIDDRFSLLTAGRRGRRSGARHRTLEASIVWSWDLLDDDEQAMLQRLAVFPGPFDLDGAIAVGGLGASADEFDVLTALVDKSLVTVRSSDAHRRYGLLESIRHYGLARLHEHGQTAAAKDAHLDHTLEQVLALHGGLDLDDAGMNVVLVPAPLRDDIRAADAWGHEAGRYDDVVDLHWPLAVTHVSRGSHHEPTGSLRRLVDSPHLDLVHNARAHALIVTFLGVANKQGEALTYADRALDVARAAEEEGHFVLVPTLAGICHALGWQRSGASGFARECLSLARDARDAGWHRPLAASGAWAGLALFYDGHVEEGIAAIDEAIAAGEEVGSDHLLASALAHAATVKMGSRPLPELLELRHRAREAVPADSPRMHTLVDAFSGVWLDTYSYDADGRSWLAHGYEHAGTLGTGSHALMASAEMMLRFCNQDFEGVLEVADLTLAIFERSDNVWFQLMLACAVVEAKVWLGHDDVAEALTALQARVDASLQFQPRAWTAGIEALLLRRDDPVGAMNANLRYLAIMRETGFRGFATQGLAYTAALLAALSRHTEAARTTGVGMAWHEDRGYDVRLQDLWDETERLGRTALGDEAWEAEVGAGRRATFEELTDALLAEAADR